MEFLDERPWCWEDHDALIGTALKACCLRCITSLHCIMNRSLTYFKNAMMHEIELAWMEAFKLMYLCSLCFGLSTHFHACIHINAKCMHTLACESADAHLSQVIVCGALVSEIWHTHTLIHRSHLKPLTAYANTSSWINPCSRSTVCC